ncbi:tetratricopeptide repeat protein [Cyanobium sp. ATX 6A2]|uniref:tetratricopeptide repeat protein n=1 Tax=Cyanobium sp. ATX 6A2 TaxID=2823700 RepID=UPI0020CBB1C6|nr:tetratricopeptide repeat protein [Cyanobium sp. ATX 6A2]MCP9889032.1 tetratricopeptide repeat protein [Cyanobium sp. ATX 6A2]
MDTSAEELRFSLPEAGFDRSQLPAGTGEPGTGSFRQTVTAFFQNAYRSRGGRLDVAFSEGRIDVHWSGAQEQQDALQRALALIEQGRRPEARELLETLLQLEPGSSEALYNLGLLCSDAGELERAAELLERCVALDPTHANAWVALGMAGLRGDTPEQARPALEKAVELEPGNPDALRAYGTLLLMQHEPREAVAVLRRAQVAAPGDPVVLLTVAQALMAADLDAHAAEADQLLRRVLELVPRGEIAEKARRASQRIANHNLRRSQGEGLRPMVVDGLRQALQIYEGLKPEQRKAVLVEVSAIGEKGLPVNQPLIAYNLETLPGSFSALQLACLIEIGARQVLGMADAGFGFEGEVQEALEEYKAGP